jgi:hypothetical protein
MLQLEHKKSVTRDLIGRDHSWHQRRSNALVAKMAATPIEKLDLTSEMLSHVTQHLETMWNPYQRYVASIGHGIFALKIRIPSFNLSI